MGLTATVVGERAVAMHDARESILHTRTHSYVTDDDQMIDECDEDIYRMYIRVYIYVSVCLR